MTTTSSLTSALTSATSATSASTASSTASALSSTSLSMTDFLKLMTTQMKSQDPFNPMDNSQMASQLAQFSSVAGISEMNTSLKSLTSELSGSRVGDAASWIGKKALVTSTTATPLSDGTYSGQVTLPSAASSMTVSLVDSSGAVVHTESLGSQSAGDVSFSWDGKDSSGTYVGGSALSVVVTAKDASGNTVTPSSTATWAAIGGVQSPASGTTKLVTPLGSIDPTTALQLS